MKKHPADTAEYWRSLARSERAFARDKRSGRFGSVESIRIHENNALEYEERARKIEEGGGGK